MKNIHHPVGKNLLWLFVGFIFLHSCTVQLQPEQEALKKIEILESLMAEANAKGIDVTREETLHWFSKEFLKFADWDEANKEAVEKLFEYYGPYKKDKTKYAEELPDLERQKVIEMLDKGIEQLKMVLGGKQKRRPVNKIDWQNIEVGDDMLLSNGKPVFLFDYFSKTVGSSLSNSSIYNDHLGAIYHGGENLYPVDHDRAINSFLLKEDGSFDEALMKEVTDISDANVGFLLYWNMGIPEWVEEKEPEVRKGRSLFTGYDIDNPLAREVWGKIVRETGSLTKGKKVTQLGYILSNEPHWYSEVGNWRHKYKEMNGISSYTLQKFRNWLSVKYNDQITGLNKNWEASYNSFNNIEFEIPMDTLIRGSAKWYDWCRFNMDRGTAWFTYIQNELHAVNPDADTHIKIMPKEITEHERSHGIDLEALTELTTMIGDDAKTTRGRSLITNKPEKWEAKYAYYWDELAVSYDFMESVAPDKIHINSEAHFLSTSHWRDLHTSPDYVRSCYWLATIHGMDVSISWFWARDADGSPEDRLEGELNFFDPALAGSYAGSANMQPQTVNEVAQVYMDMNSFSEEIMALRKQRRPVRLFYTETTAINEKTYVEGQLELYESLYFEGFPMGHATEKIIKKQDHKNWDVIVVHHTPYVTDTEFDVVQSYLDHGGTVIIDQHSLTKNEYGQARNEKLSAQNGQLILMDNEASITDIKNKTLELIANNLHEVVLTETNGTNHKSCTWRVAKKPNGGYLMTILNLGKNTASLLVNRKDEKDVNCINMLTGQVIGAAFELKSEGVLLLEIKEE